MLDLKENKFKETYIKEILEDINDIPVVYLKTLYALIHSFKENILIVEHADYKQNTKTLNQDNDDFDWDSLIDEIHNNRRLNNDKLSLKINNLST